MKLNGSKTPGPRNGFTTIELLVVIAILALMSALLLAGVMRLLALGPEHQIREDLRQLTIACQEFKSHYGVYPPSRKIVLSNDPNVYRTHPLGPTSWAQLSEIWPNLDPNQSYDWSNGQMTGKYTAVLEGDQCLVFFLGGVQQGRGCLGFGKGDENPLDRRGKNLVKPFFPFVNERLYRRNPSHSFLSYKDAFNEKPGQPLAYFRSMPGKAGIYTTDDCQSLGVQPYYHKTKGFEQYYEKGKFQIISAGADQRFGPGGEYYQDRGDVPINGKDDFANFHPLKLGSPAY